MAGGAEYRVGRFTLRPHRQLLDDGVPVAIGRKALDLLSVLAEAEGALVTKDELMAAVWPNAIVEDNAIQVHVAALRKTLGKDAELLTTAHGLGYRLAVSIAPATASRPLVEAEAPTSAAVAEAPARQRLPARTVAVVLVVLAVVAGGAYALLRNANQDARAATPPTIAVLAFQPADGSDNARLLADGLARSVASSLSRYDVTVIAASSSLQLTPAQRPQARSLLGARFIVDGRIVSDHGKLTVSTQVSDARQNILVFSFDVQGNSALSAVVADRIASKLALSIDPSKFLDDPTQKFTASDYTLIARGNEAIEHNDYATNMRVNRQLAERFPDDGELRAGAGFATVFAAARSLPPSQKTQFLEIARADIARAEHLAPRSGLVYLAKSQLVNGPMAFAAQERLQRQSMQLSPAFAPTYNALGETMLAVGRVDEGVALLQRSIQLDPLSELVNAGATWDYIRVGREAEARQALARQQAIWPGSQFLPSLAVEVAIYFGTPQDRVALSKKYPAPPQPIGRGDPDRPLMERAVDTRDKALIRQSIDNCFASYGKGGGQDWEQLCLVMMVHVGALDDAYRFAEFGYADLRKLYPPDDDRWLTAPPRWLDTARLFLPAMAPFRDDPRFWPVALRSGLIDYWQTTQQWPDFCRGQLDACKAHAAQAVRDAAAAQRRGAATVAVRRVGGAGA